MLQTAKPHISSSTKLSTSVEIGPETIAGPLDLRATIKSGQTAMPEWLWKDDAFSDLLPATGGLVHFSLRQPRGPFAPKLHLEVQSPEGLSDFAVGDVISKIAMALDLRRDLQNFYKDFSSDVLADAFERFPGLRLMQAWDHFDALVSCLLTQWSSVKGWNTVSRRLRRNFGAAFRMTDGSIYYAAPTADSLASAPMEELRKCGTGFRAKYLRKAATMIASNEIDLEDVGEMPYQDAKTLLMEIPGVGTKVADCLLLYGYGRLEAAPVDIWMHRVIQNLYLKGEKVSQRKAEEFLRKRFGSWAGYAQLYLYHFARVNHIV